MTPHRIRWPAAVGGALLAELGQVAASFLWVAIYSYAINPGQPFATYQQYAELTAPWVSVLAGAPIFYAASRWIGRNRPTALALFLAFFIIDVAIHLMAPQGIDALMWGMVAVSFATKLVACYLGGLHAERAQGAAHR